MEELKKVDSAIGLRSWDRLINPKSKCFVEAAVYEPKYGFMNGCHALKFNVIDVNSDTA